MNMEDGANMINADKILSRMSYHVVYDKSIMEAMDFASKNGFSGIQIAIESPHLSFENLGAEEIKAVKDKGEKLGIRIVLHAPDNASLVSSSPKINRGTMSYYADLIVFAQKIGASIITIHPGAPSHFPTDTASPELFPKEDLEAYVGVLKANLDELLELAKGRVCICIENLDLENFVLDVLQDYVERTELKLCWDLPKTYDKKDGKVKKETLDFLLKNRSSVKQVHLHSLVNGKSHRVIQPGVIDLYHYLNLLDGVDVSDYCIEVRPREKAAESLANLRKILLSKS